MDYISIYDLGLKLMSENAVETGTLGSQVVVLPPNGQTVETNQPDAEQEADISSEESPEEEEERRKHECNSSAAGITEDLPASHFTPNFYTISSDGEAVMRSILDQQSIIQFRQYAQEQHPKDIAKQDELIRQMQDQYFDYYMENIQRSQMINQQNQIDQLIDLREASHVNSTGEPIPLPLVPASMWTRKDIADFKKDILANHRECCIKISSLASATVSLCYCRVVEHNIKFTDKNSHGMGRR
ncbi:hypothetical protein ACTXT7_001707 [Hymenolepis weldensis]